MVRVTLLGEPTPPRRRGNAIVPLTAAEVSQLQEGQDLDFKREVNVDKPDLKARLVDDVTAFLNRGPSRIIVGVVEKGGRVDRFWPLGGDADQMALRVQSVIQDSISPMPIDVQVVPIHHEEGYLLDIQIPRHPIGPFMNRLTGGYLVRSGARNVPIDPGMLRSRFVDESGWLGRLEELTATEDADLAANGRLVPQQGLRIAILPREHFDYQRASFSEEDRVRYPGPIFHEHSDPFFKATEDGHEIYSSSFNAEGLDRLFIRDDWFVHAQIAFAIQQEQGEGRLRLYEFNADVERYLKALAAFFDEQEIEGPFAVTLALRSLGETEHFGRWFSKATTVRTLRPKLVTAVDDPNLVAEFLRKVKQATILA